MRPLRNTPRPQSSLRAATRLYSLLIPIASILSSFFIQKHQYRPEAGFHTTLLGVLDMATTQFHLAIEQWLVTTRPATCLRAIMQQRDWDHMTLDSLVFLLFHKESTRPPALCAVEKCALIKKRVKKVRISRQ